MRLGLDLCVPHECHCGSVVDARGVHSFVSKKAPGRTARHHAMNDMIARGFASAGFPVSKEPTVLFRTDGKQPDGLALPMVAEWQGTMLGRHSNYLSVSRFVRSWSHLCRQVRRQSLPLPARTIPALTADTHLNPLRQRL